MSSDQHTPPTPRIGFTLEPGQVVKDRYEVVRELGGGGQSLLFEVVDQIEDRHLAMKVLAPKGSENARSMAQRLAREARVLRELDSDYVVRCEGIFVDAQGKLLFLLLELLQGDNLRMVMHRRALSLDESLTIGIQVASALAEAHAQQVIHRDIKPENIFVLEGAKLHVKLLDFGIAKVVGVSGGTSRAIGTPLYMAPEQLARGELTPALDVYSLCHLLYELILGQHAFAKSDGMPPEPGVAIYEHMKPQEIPPLSTRIEYFPGALSDCLAQGMRKNWRERHPDASALERALRACRREQRARSRMSDEAVRTELSEMALDWSLAPRENTASPSRVSLAELAHTMPLDLPAGAPSSEVARSSAFVPMVRTEPHVPVGPVVEAPAQTDAVVASGAAKPRSVLDLIGWPQVALFVASILAGFLAMAAHDRWPIF